MNKFNYSPGLYDVITTYTIESVPYYGVEKGWFTVNSGKIRGDSTYVRLASQRGGLVRHDGVVDLDATFRFLKEDLYSRIDSIFKNTHPPITQTVEKYRLHH